MSLTFNIPEWFLVLMAILFPILIIVHGVRDYYSIKLKMWDIKLTAEKQRIEKQVREYQDH